MVQQGLSVRVVFLGTPGFAVPSLEACAARFEVVGVVTQPDRPAGRGRATVAPPVKIAAEELGLPVLQPASMRDPGAVDALRRWDPDVLAVVAYGEMLRRAVRQIAPHGCVNVHPSLLPRHRGAAPVAAAILEGDDVTGVSIMLVERDLDAGPVLAHVRERISTTDTAVTLGQRLAVSGATLLVEVLPRWVDGQITPAPQDDVAATCIRQIRRIDGLVHWERPAAVIARYARAFEPWPGTYTHWNQRVLKLGDVAEVGGSGHTEGPGHVAGELSDGKLLIGTGDGALAVGTLQLEGKRAQSAAEFVRGHQGIVGANLGT